MAKNSFSSWIEKAQAQIDSGNFPNLYRWIYLQVDSEIDEDVVGEFDIAELQLAGLEGWDIVAVIPKTVGVALKNYSTGSTVGSSWGGGMGGNVVGVYLLLRKEVTDANDPQTQSDAKRIISSLESRGFEI